MTVFIAHLSGWWAWRGLDALLRANEPTFHHWFTAVLGIILTAALLCGVVALFRGKTRVIVVVRAGQRLGPPDMACIRSGLLDQTSAVILASMRAHQAHKGSRTARG